MIGPEKKSSSRPRPPSRGARRPESSFDAWIRWTPLVIGAVFVLGVLSLFVSSWRRPTSLPVRPAGGWIDLARGEVCFLGESEPFTIQRDWAASGRYRVVADARAFEDSDCERLIRTFVRDALLGVRAGEFWRLRILEADAVSSRAIDARGDLDWPLALREEAREGAVWFSAVIAPQACERLTVDASGGDVFASARSSEEVKEKISRSIARDLVQRLTSS